MLQGKESALAQYVHTDVLLLLEHSYVVKFLVEVYILIPTCNESLVSSASSRILIYTCTCHNF